MSFLNREKYNHIYLPKIGKLYCLSKREANLIYKEIFEKRDYLKCGIRLNPGDTVFDVGANIGMFTLFAAKECSGNVSIFSFEPVKDIYEILCKNIYHHGLNEKDGVKIFNLGLTYTGGPKQATFLVYKGMTIWSTMKSEERKDQLLLVKENPDRVMNFLKVKSKLFYFLLLILFPVRSWLIGKTLDSVKTKEIQCRLTTITDICLEHPVSRIDLLKIDVEGAELDVLNGIEDQHWGMIKQIVMELRDVDNRLRRIKTLLKEKGFNKMCVSESEWSKLMGLREYNLYAIR